MTNPLKILQLNINGLSSSTILALNKYMYAQGADVIALSETKYVGDLGREFPNYLTVLKPSEHNPKRRGGVALLVRNEGLVERRNELEDPGTDAIFATVLIKGRRLLMSSLYVQPHNKESLDKVLNQIRAAEACVGQLRCEGLVAVGDYNARHPWWNETITNTAGIRLAEFVEVNNLSVLNHCKENTFLCDAGGSIIDLVVVSSAMVRSVEGQYADPTTELLTGAPRRGHIPVWTTLSGNASVTSARMMPCWRDADWELFQRTADELALHYLPQLYLEKDPAVLWNWTKRCLVRAAEVAVPQKQVCTHSKPYWTPRLSDLSREVRVARKEFKRRSNFRNGERLDYCKHNFTEALQQAKSEHLEMRAKSINAAHGTAFWKEYRRVCRSKQVGGVGDIVLPDGTVLTGNEEKATAFYDSIFTGNFLNRAQFDTVWREEVDAHAPNFEGENMSNGSLSEPVTVGNITEAIKACKCSQKSTDPDGLHPLMFKYCGEFVVCMLHALFNSVLGSGKWPWDSANVVLLRKQGKPAYNNTGSFRPIALTSYVGKLLESILSSRLKGFVDEHGLLPDEQHGFRKHRSTATYLVELLSVVEDNKSRGSSVGGLFLDLQKAYDSVWPQGLVYRLEEMGVSGRFLKVIHSLVSDRFVAINVNGHLSGERKCHVGLPQGSVLSPLLFALYISDMTKDLPGAPLQYADDCSVICWGATDAELQEKCCRVALKVDQWLRKWRMQANYEKTDLLCFKGSLEPIHVGCQSIAVKPCTRVLGLLVDCKLNFKAQLEQSRGALRSKWSMVSPYVLGGWAISTALTVLYSVIVPAAYYMAHLWDRRQELSLYKYLKEALRVPFYPPKEFLFMISGTKNLDVRYTFERLNLMRQCIKGGVNINHITARKGKLAASMRADLAIVFGRNIPKELGNMCLTKGRLFSVERKVRERRWQSFLLRQGQSVGLYGFISLDRLLWDPIPMAVPPKVFGAICSVVTGQCSLLEHLYKAGLSFSPTCVCLEDDETVGHYVFECPLYEKEREGLELDSWESIARFLIDTGRLC